MSIPTGTPASNWELSGAPFSHLPQLASERAPSSGDAIPLQGLSGGALGMPTEQLSGEGQGMFTQQSRNPDTSLFEWKELSHV